MQDAKPTYSFYKTAHRKELPESGGDTRDLKILLRICMRKELISINKASA